MDQPTFDAFYAQSYHRVVAHVHLTCGNLAEAQDCAQEAFVRAWDKRRQLDRDGHPEAWVRTVAHRISISRWRRDRRQLPIGDDGPEPRSNDPDAADRVALHRALQQLPVETRRTIVLHHLHDLSVNDVATELGVPPGTVKARLSRGRARLAELLRTDAVDAAGVPASLTKETTMPFDGAGGDDPFGLHRAAAPAHRVPRPPASEIRRRGGLRRRHRLLAAGAGGVAGALLVVGLGLGATGAWVTGPWSDPTATATTGRAVPPVGGSPSTGAGLGWENVPSEEQMWVLEPGDLELVEETTVTGQPDHSIGNCMGDFPALDAQQTLLRRYSSEQLRATQVAVVMEFEHEAAASRARELIGGWYRDDRCGADLRSGFPVAGSNSGTQMSVPGATAAEFAQAHWSEDPDGTEATWEDVALVQVDNRLAWVLHRFVGGQDNNCDVDEDGPTGQLCVPARQAPEVAALLAS